MALVVVGGHTRNIGKTGVMAGVIAAFPERAWTAIKITQYGHGVCSANGEPCDCATDDHTIAISEERSTTSNKDTARYLTAGAKRSMWVRTRQGQLAEAMPRVRMLIGEADDAIVESNSVLRFVKPDLALFVVDGRVDDFKESALRYLDRIDAFVCVGDAVGTGAANWENVAASLLRGKPCLRVNETFFRSEELEVFVRNKLANQRF
ncbi:MAG: hypothetical protein PW792_11395 [Acidobacteriaceae bacterium]|nr:hypothetical protein [Acidobacteriaceae bacterium]